VTGTVNNKRREVFTALIFFELLPIMKKRTKLLITEVLD
jgi:hypothetical protein